MDNMFVLKIAAGDLLVVNHNVPLQWERFYSDKYSRNCGLQDIVVAIKCITVEDLSRLRTVGGGAAMQ